MALFCVEVRSTKVEVFEKFINIVRAFNNWRIFLGQFD